LNPEDLVGKTEICSECGKQKKIQIALEQGPDKQGEMHTPYLKCEDCASPDLEKDEDKKK
jgi:DNA-directed RNA polymerase subunit RPC12/RpoP